MALVPRKTDVSGGTAVSKVRGWVEAAPWTATVTIATLPGLAAVTRAVARRLTGYGMHRDGVYSNVL